MTAQYWTMTGFDMWMLNTSELKMRNLVTGEELPVNVVIPEGFYAVPMPKIGGEKKGPKKKSKKPPAGKKKTKYTPSEYKGVRSLNGGKTWEAKFYDKRKKKVVYIGCYPDEILAAAEVQKKKGNDRAYHKLMEEYAEGDGLPPAPAAPEGEKIEKLKGPVTYMCGGCGEGYEADPGRCSKCGSGAIEAVRLQAAAARPAAHCRNKR